MFACMNVVQAGLRAVHDLGPEIRRAISGNLEEDDFFLKSEEPAHRVRMRLRLDLKFKKASPCLYPWCSKALFTLFLHEKTSNI